MRTHVPPPLVCAIVVAAGIALAGHSRQPEPPTAIADDRGIDRVVGTIGGPLVKTSHGWGAPIDSGETTVWVWTDVAIQPGQRIAAIGRLRRPRAMLDPGAPPPVTRSDYELAAIHIDVLGDDPGITARAWRWAGGIQATWTARIAGDDPASTALRGIVTGDRAGVPDSLDQRWRAVGIYHVLSVSGLHLAVVAGLAFALLRRLIAASPLGGRTRPARWAAPIAIVLAIVYTLVTGAQLATIRALVVVTIVLIAQMLDRPVRLVDALGVAAIAILLWRPQDLFDPSFQLSFIAALTLALRPRTRTGGNRVVRWLVAGLATSAWVTLTTAPITALHFHQVAPGGVLGNLVLTPAVELVALPLGFAGVLFDLWPCTSAAVWIVARVDDVAGALAHGMPVGAIAVGSSLVVVALVALSLTLAARTGRSRLDLLAWLAMCGLWVLARTPPPLGALRVTFLDVGQGDAALVELPTGEVWLIDAGGLPSARTWQAQTLPGRAISRTLDVYGHREIDLAILSHPHPDHYLGLAAIDVPIRQLWFVDSNPDARADGDPAAKVGRSSFAAIAATLGARGTLLVQPPLGPVQRGPVELIVLAPRYQPTPDSPVVLAADPVRTVNDNSLVVALRYAGKTILFAGDLETEGEDQLVAAGLARVDVVKVAHHGSRTSSSEPFVAATHPSIAVISCGVANTFGFPSEVVVERWRHTGARVERTDLGGAITVTIHGDGNLTVERFAGPGW